MTLTIRVLDANDHAPTCTKTEINVVVPDSAVVGYELAKLSCSDGDSGVPNGVLRYSLLASSAVNLARVDKHGRVQLAGSLSSLEKDTFSLSVRAQDGGSPPRFVDVRLKVRVRDTNNMSPQFSQAVYTFLVTENKPANTLVGHTSE